MIKSFLMIAVIIGSLLPSAVFAQKVTVSGTVTTEEGEPLPGVNIVIVGTTDGTISNLDGDYTLEANSEDKLLFSYIGFKEQEVSINPTGKTNVVLQASDEQIEEVIVVGYGVQKKESVTAAIVQTTGEEIERAGGVTSLSNALTGLLPGVTTIQSSGEPGNDAADIYIRGRSSWNNNASDPLVLVDGVRSEMDNVDPSEVASISVLKDASATAVFGVEGANGVILITTKRGKVGKPRMSFSANASMKQVSRIPQYLDSYDALKLKNEAIEYEAAIEPTGWSNYTPTEILEYYRTQEHPYIYPNADFQSHMVKKNAMSYRFNYSLSGGTKFVKYYAALAYTHDADLLKTEDFGQGYNPEYSYNRFNFRSNFDFSLTPTTSLAVNLSGYHGIKQEPHTRVTTGFWEGIYNAPPDLFPVRHEDGSFGSNPNYGSVSNPVVDLNFIGYDKSNRTQIITDFELDQKLDFVTKGLRIGGKLSYTNIFQTNGNNLEDWGAYTKYIDPSILTAQNATDSAAAIQVIAHSETQNQISNVGYNFIKLPVTTSSEQYNNNNDLKRNLMYRISINYARSFGRHNVTALALFKREDNQAETSWPVKREDWVGRVTYNYATRYFIQFDGAYNGSDKFGPKYRFDFFPALSLGYTISNETFFKEQLPWWNTLKFRYTYGQVGNDKGAPTFYYEEQWGSANVPGVVRLGRPNMTTVPYKFFKQTKVGNPDLRWEVSTTNNFGVDLGFFKNMVVFTLDVFKQDRDDIYLSAGQRNVPDWVPALTANIGKTEVRGYELSLELRKTFSNQLQLWFNGNYSVAKDKVIYKEDANVPPHLQAAGFPIGQPRTQLNDGINNTWDDVYTSPMASGQSSQTILPGSFRLVDYNGDGIVDQQDEVPYGYPDRPQNNYSLSFGSEFKGLSAMVQFYGAYNVTRQIATPEFPNNYSVVQPFHKDERWTPEKGDAAEYRALRFNTGSGVGQYWLKDATFLRIKRAEIRYSMTFAALQKVGIKKMQIFINGTDLYLWTKMIEDREGGSYNNTNYPRTRTFNLGLNLNF